MRRWSEGRRPFLKSTLSRSPRRIRPLARVTAWVFLALDLFGLSCRSPRGLGSLKFKSPQKRAWGFLLQQPARASPPRRLPRHRGDHGGPCPSRVTWRPSALLSGPPRRLPRRRGHRLRQRLPPGPQGSRLGRVLPPRVLRARLRDLPARRPQACVLRQGRCWTELTLPTQCVKHQVEQLPSHARSSKARSMTWVCKVFSAASGLWPGYLLREPHAAHVDRTVRWLVCEKIQKCVPRLQ